MITTRKLIAFAAFVATASAAVPIVAHAQMYECTTTTTTRTAYGHDDEGYLYITTVTVRSTVCKQLE
jgi:phage tail sheath gpL-like